MPPPNEALVCNVVAWFFADRTGQSVSERARPDQEHDRPSRTPQAVERVYRVGELDLSVEHTILESFVEQTHDNLLFSEMMQPLQDTLTGKLPLPGSYSVLLPIGAFKGLPRAHYPVVRAALEAWVVANAPSLDVAGNEEGRSHQVESAPPGLAFAVRLVRSPTSDGKVRIGRYVDETLEPLRTQRCITALQRKCPKLAASKEAVGGESVLAFECGDLGLGGVGPVTRVIKEAILLAGVPIPDWILLIEPDRSGWSLSVLRYPDGTIPKAYTETLEVPVGWFADVPTAS